MAAHIMARRTAYYVLVVATVLVLAVNCRPPISTTPFLCRGGWCVTFNDEFNGDVGSPPDGSIWRPQEGGTGWGNNELEYYTHGDNAFLDGEGHLVIEARSDSDGRSCWYGTCRYTSGRMSTFESFSQRYGRFEARIKAPRGKGTWPAFWLLGENVYRDGHPQCGEIDVMEVLGDRLGEVQQHAVGPGLKFGSAYTLPDAQSITNWHTYSVQWSPDLIEWQIDGHTTLGLTKNEAGESWVFDHPFFLLLNLAVGGDWPGDPDAETILPARMLVDYVRVYRAEPS